MRQCDQRLTRILSAANEFAGAKKNGSNFIDARGAQPGQLTRDRLRDFVNRVTDVVT